MQKKREIVKYENQLNQVNFSDFGVVSKRIFFAVLSQANSKPAGRKIKLSREQLLDLEIYTDTNKYDLVNMRNDLRRTATLCYGLNFERYSETEDKIILDYVRLFKQISVEFDKKHPEDLTKMELHFVIEKEAEHFINSNFPFTVFSLPEFQSLKSGYAQNLFIHLKQFESTKQYFVTQEELKKVLFVPNSYRQSDIDKRVLKPCMQELQPLFPGLMLQKVRDERDRRKIKFYAFTWKEKPKKQTVSTRRSSAATGKKTFSIPKDGDLPTKAELEAFQKAENLSLTLGQMRSILSAKLDTDSISDWRAYLRGAAARTAKKPQKNSEYPEWWDFEDEKADDELVQQVMELQKQMKASEKKRKKS